ncbi:helix-turn-helix domain-containing protein [Teichococcus aestuarii]|uniref:helix-turn-helix domain-containing protein n=1 Tax=Teichococcus aestuarii TaxID=568898 RepID=UPI003605C0A1
MPTAVRKSFQILEAVAAAPRPLSGQALAERLGLTRSTLSRLALSRRRWAIWSGWSAAAGSSARRRCGWACRGWRISTSAASRRR